MPCGAQLFLMQRCPFGHKAERSPRQGAAQYGEVFDADDSLIVAIRRMKMRWQMVAVVHAYDYAVKPAEFRHPR